MHSTDKLPLRLISLVSIILFTLVQYLQFKNWNFDDSLIVYRLVENITAGNGWAYNLGEVHNPSTSALNTIILSLLTTFGLRVDLAAHLLGALSIFTTAVIVFVLFRERFNIVLALVTSMLTIHLLAHNSTWGLEVHLFAATLMFFVYLESCHAFSWPAIAFLILVRPDGGLIAILKWLKEWVKTRSISLKGMIAVFLILLPWIIFSLTKFGNIFPDTLSSKIWQGQSGYWGRGHIYFHALKDHLLSDGYSVFIFVSGFIGSILILLRKDVLLYLLCFVGLQQIAYVFFNVPGYHWYFSILDFALLISSSYFLSFLIDKFFGKDFLRGTLVSLLSSLAALAYSTYVFYSTSPGALLDPRDQAYKEAILKIDSEVEQDGSIATLEVGTVGYHTKRKIIDLVGLTSQNPEFITGEHSDAFFEDPPLIVLLHDPLWHFERTIFDDLRFRIQYELKGRIANPHFPMQYYLRNQERSNFSEAELRAYIEKNFSLYKQETNEKVLKRNFDTEVLCALDQVNGKLLQQDLVEIPKLTLRVEGWALDKKQSVIQPSVIVLLSGETETYSIKASRHSREDVAKHLNLLTLRDSGYSAEGSLIDVKSGKYKIGISQLRGDDFVYCEFPQTLIIN